LDEALWRVLRNHELEHAFFAIFPQTTPLWYGIWINSPLQKNHVELLQEVLGLAFADLQPSQDKDHFLAALKAAAQWNLPLHVSMFPPGHVDFGWHTVFPHCPRCKAETSLDRWQENYSKDTYNCKTCGHVFIPNDHHKCEPDDADFDADSLEVQMGTKEYWEFVREFLLYRGRPNIRVDEIIARLKSRKPLGPC
jgi:Zn ribbon nucleic-acid-binding protein